VAFAPVEPYLFAMDPLTGYAVPLSTPRMSGAVFRNAVTAASSGFEAGSVMALTAAGTGPQQLVNVDLATGEVTAVGVLPSGGTVSGTCALRAAGDVLFVAWLP
jgi:hypothetical protein